MNLYVGNLAVQTTEAELEQLFRPFGAIGSITIARDRYSGEPRGFGFVDMPEQANGLAAISGLAGAKLHGNMITVNEARPGPERSRNGRRSNDNRRGSW